MRSRSAFSVSMNSESSMKPNIWPKVGSAARRLAHAEPGGRGVAHPDDQQPVGAEVDRRTQGRGLAHGAVAEVLVVQQNGPKQERDGQARHQMLQRQLHARALAKRPRPGLDRRGAKHKK